MTDKTAASHARVFGAERAKAFIDAVVAIAMTLLILPLMESVVDVGDTESTTAEWAVEHADELVSFVLSFGIIALFWISHHSLFSRVERVTPALLWISMAWLLTIVWLPVATALTGRMGEDDALVKVVYIGAMMLTALVTLGQRLYLLRHPQLHTVPVPALRAGMISDASRFLLFALALTIAVLVPAIGYSALLLMLLTGVVQNLLQKVIGGGPESA